MYPLVYELAGDGIPVTVTCRVLKIARQPYYRWLAQPVTDAELDQAYRANALFDAHRDDPEFGHRLLADEAARAGGPGQAGEGPQTGRPEAGGPKPEADGPGGPGGPRAGARTRPEPRRGAPQSGAPAAKGRGREPVAASERPRRPQSGRTRAERKSRGAGPGGGAADRREGAERRSGPAERRRARPPGADARRGRGPGAKADAEWRKRAARRADQARIPLVSVSGANRRAARVRPRRGRGPRGAARGSGAGAPESGAEAKPERSEGVRGLAPVSARQRRSAAKRHGERSEPLGPPALYLILGHYYVSPKWMTWGECPKMISRVTQLCTPTLAGWWTSSVPMA